MPVKLILTPLIIDNDNESYPEPDTPCAPTTRARSQFIHSHKCNFYLPTKPSSPIIPLSLSK